MQNNAKNTACNQNPKLLGYPISVSAGPEQPANFRDRNKIGHFDGRKFRFPARTLVCIHAGAKIDAELISYTQRPL